MDAQDRKDTRDYAWKYFALHADQRLRTFNFYLLIVTVIVGGLLAYLKDARSPAYVVAAGLILMVLSWIFWRLDGRACELIQNAEDVLKAVEVDIPTEQVPEELRLFAGEQKKTEALRRAQGGRPGWNPVSWVRGHYSYYDCFRAAFLIFAVVGLLIVVAAFFLPALPASSPPAVLPAPQQTFYIGNQPVKPVLQPGPKVNPP
jgi:hypothetical protein